MPGFVIVSDRPAGAREASLVPIGGHRRHGERSVWRNKWFCSAENEKDKKRKRGEGKNEEGKSKKYKGKSIIFRIG